MQLQQRRSILSQMQPNRPLLGHHSFRQTDAPSQVFAGKRPDLQVPSLTHGDRVAARHEQVRASWPELKQTQITGRGLIATLHLQDPRADKPTLQHPSFCFIRVETAQLKKRQVVAGARPVGIQQQRCCISPACLREIGQTLMQRPTCAISWRHIRIQSECHGEGCEALDSQ